MPLFQPAGDHSAHQDLFGWLHVVVEVAGVVGDHNTERTNMGPLDAHRRRSFVGRRLDMHLRKVRTQHRLGLAEVSVSSRTVPIVSFGSGLVAVRESYRSEPPASQHPRREGRCRALRVQAQVSVPGSTQFSNCAAFSARSSSGCGMIPKITVTAAHTAIAALLKTPGAKTCGVSLVPSVKNISTMTCT